MAVNERDTAGEDSRIAALYREAALEEPPPHLDASIPRDARRALDAPAAARARPWWSAWRVPVAFAAVAVLSVSVVTIISREGGEPLTIGEPAATPDAPSAAARQAAPPTVGAAQASHESDVQAPEGARRKLEARQRDDRPGDASAPATQSAAPRGEPIAPPRASAADASAQAAAGASPTLADQETSAPAPANEAAAAATPPAAAQRRRAETSAAPAAKPAMAARNALTPAVAAIVVELDGRAPAAWLERVATLRRDGRTDDADALLAELRRRYPDEPLPEAFR
jgi:hypothetical protein